MAKQCGDKTNKSAVEMECYVTKCKMSAHDAENHVVEITNQRRNSIYQAEFCATSLNQLVGLGAQAGKKVLLGKTISPSNTSTRKQLGLTHGGTTGTDEIETVIEFFDHNQRLSNGVYQGAPESYSIDYEMELT